MKKPKRGIEDNSFFRSWRYDPTKKANNEFSTNILGMKCKISSVSEITFHVRKHLGGERKGVKIGTFKLDGNGKVLFGWNEAYAAAMEQREAWRDQEEGKPTANPIDIPTFDGLINRYKDPKVRKKSPELAEKNLPIRWDENEARIRAIYASLLKVNCKFITKKMIHEAQTEYLADREEATGKRPHSQVRRMFRALRPILVWGRNEGYIQPETLMGLRANVPKGEDRERSLLPGEWQKIAPVVDAMKNDRGLFIRFLLLTSARFDMPLKMKWADIRRVNTGTIDKPNWLTIWCVPADKMKMGFLAIFPLVEDSLRMIEELRNRPGYASEPHDYVFPESMRKAWGPTPDSPKGGNPDVWQKEIFEKSGTKKWHRHDLRRTLASILRMFGADMPTVEKLLAHRTGNGTKATRAYLKIGENLPALKLLAEHLTKAHRLLRRIEQGWPCDELEQWYAEISLSENVQSFMQKFGINEKLVHIVPDPQYMTGKVRALYEVRS